MTTETVARIDEHSASFENGVLTIFYWYDEADREADGLWWCDDLEWPGEEP